MPFIRTVNITWWYFFFQVLELLACESKSRCSDRCACVINYLKCTDMCPCRDCNITVEIESDVKSDDERDECDKDGDSATYDDEEDIYCTLLLMTNFIHIGTILLVFVTDE